MSRASFGLPGHLAARPGDDIVPEGVLGEGLVYLDVDGVEYCLTKSQIETIQWTPTGNNLFWYGGATYTANLGQLDPPELNAYPLSCAAVPAVFDQPLMTGMILATGTCTVAPYAFTDVPAQATIQTVGQTTYVESYFGAPQMLTENGTTLFALVTGDGQEGFECQFQLDCEVDQQGNMGVIQIVNAQVEYIDANGDVTVSMTTNNQFWYDGSFFPYEGGVVELSGPGQYTIKFYDSPSVSISKPLPGGKVKANYKFFTYPMLFNAAAGSVPCLIGSPLYWSMSGVLECDQTGQWALTNSSSTAPTEVGVCVLPTWLEGLPEVITNGPIRHEKRTGKNKSSGVR